MFEQFLQQKNGVGENIRIIQTEKSSGFQEFYKVSENRQEQDV